MPTELWLDVLRSAGPLGVVLLVVYYPPAWLRGVFSGWATERRGEREQQAREREADRQSRHDIADRANKAILGLGVTIKEERREDRAALERHEDKIVAAIEKQTTDLRAAAAGGCQYHPTRNGSET